ncbi:NAD(P)-binding protein [Chitinophaga sp. 30R24]|uniref:NAD(P)-binding protein n=1 Tax=Chitinophaga sp. 30R24 TaxID=3248838 RepID=UPI003B8F6371
MNGENTRNKTLSRKDFLRYMAIVAGATVTAVQYIACSNRRNKYAHIGGRIHGASAAIGHQLRNGHFAAPATTERVDVVIVGSGVAGLSAARKLRQQGDISFKVLELETRVGGNAAYGENAYSHYPLGAHYLPLPNLSNRPLLDLLEEAGILTGYNEAGWPVYNETDLCFDPEERLFIHGRWQEGLVPQFGVPAIDLAEIRRFFAEMERLRWQRGADGLYAFDIPLANSSKDAVYTALDNISMKDYLQQEGYVSEALHWYLDYCCRDDYGAGTAVISAWAGIHYFAGRKGKAANADSSQVLTWPQGNGRLVEHLRQFSEGHIQPHCLAYRVTPVGNQVYVDYLEVTSGHTHRLVANSCILAVPQFVARRLLPASTLYQPQHFVYSPWLVANITLDQVPDSQGYPLCWDNVMYKGRSLGYVNAQQQQLSQQKNGKQVITWYLPLDHMEPVASREYALGLQHPHWVKLIADDLEAMHPGIHRMINIIDVWIWGHGMIRPRAGFITSSELVAARQSGYPNIFYAHSDLSGVSIFEEAFYYGNQAATALLASTGHAVS